MQVGGLQETVQVEGRSGIDVTTPDVAHTVNEKYYRDLPIVTAADVRLAEAVLQIQPGYLPMRPNGDPMFRGSQFNSRINGGQTMATENFFDGAAFGYAVGHQQSHESTPPVEAVQEVKVIYDVLFGPVRAHQRRLHRVHRQVRHELVPRQPVRLRCRRHVQLDRILRQEGGHRTPPLSNNNFGATFGGPVSCPGTTGTTRRSSS